ncbi:hypothetical protein D3C71_1669910 [compost metagenome]
MLDPRCPGLYFAFQAISRLDYLPAFRQCRTNRLVEKCAVKGVVLDNQHVHRQASTKIA